MLDAAEQPASAKRDPEARLYHAQGEATGGEHFFIIRGGRSTAMTVTLSSPEPDFGGDP